jgi:hypothetical protein
MYGGAGSLHWIRSGRIVEHTVHAGSVADEELLAMTEAVLSESADK